MTSNDRPEERPGTWLRHLRGLLATLLVLALAACGPGSGGTGTGPVGNVFFSSSFSPSGGTGTIPTTITLALQDTAVRLDVACGRTVFTASWDAAAATATNVLPGRLETNGQSVDAVLRLEFGGAPQDSLAVTATMFDASGAVVFGPLQLDRLKDPQGLAGNCG